MAESGWRRRLVAGEPPSIWQWATGLLAVVFAAERFATSVFYAQFGASPEDVGIGIGQSLIEGVVLFVVLVVGANVLVLLPWMTAMVRTWFDVQRSAARLITAAREHPRRLFVYVVFGAACFVAAVSSFLFISRVNRWLWSIGFVLTIWAIMRLAAQLESPFAEIPDQPSVPVDEIRRHARRLVVAMGTLLTLVFLLAPSYWAIRDAHSVGAGHSVSGFPSAAWRAQRAQVTWLRQPAPMNDVASHCLMYLGQSAGVTILFDVTDHETLRLPTAEIAVTAVPSAGSPSARCPTP
jgi:hypothetical protein